jgi:hypothetical protein
MKFLQNASMPWMAAIALQGNGGNGVGIAMNGRVPALPLSNSGGSFGSITQNGYSTSMVCGDDVVVANWAYGAFLGHGCTLNARTIAISGGTLNMWLMEGAVANLRRAVISGATSSGVQANAGSALLVTEAQFISNGSDGLRTEVGVSVYGEGAVFLGNQGQNVRVQEGGDFYLSGGVSLLSVGSGLYGSNAGATLSDYIIGANRGAGLDCNGNGDYVANGSWITGNAANGVDNFSANVSLVKSNITGNGNIGAYAAIGGNTLATSAYMRGNVTSLYADGSTILAAGCQTQNATVVGRHSLIDVSTPVGAAPALSGVGRLNEYSSNGNIIRDSAPASGFSVAGLRTNGGSNMSFFKGVQSVQDMGSIPPNGGSLALPLDVTVTGATTGMVASVNSTYNNASVTFDAQVVAPDTVRIKGINSSAGAIDPPSATYSVIVQGFTT